MAAGPSFRILGIPVRIEPTFFVIAALLGFGGDLAFLLIWVAVVTVSVLLHELGHGVAFRAFGKQPEILLQGMGGLTSAPGTLSPGRDLVVSLAGPLTGLVLIGLPALWLEGRVPGGPSEWDTALRAMVFVNIAWSVVNLLPVLPLDGGRVAASALHLVTGRPAERAAHMVSIAVAAAAGVWAYVEGQVFATMFAGFFVAYNLSQLSHLRAGARSEDLVQRFRALLAAGRTDEVLDDVAAAYASLQFGPWNAIAADLVAEAGIVDPLTDRLLAGRERTVPALLRLQSDLHHGHRYDESARVGERAFAAAVETGRSGDAASVAYNVACSRGRAGRAAEGLTWLQRAIEHGFGDRDLIENDPDLAPLRTVPGFEALRRLGP